jgi:hypothetical protein
MREANQLTLERLRFHYGEGKSIADHAALFEHPQGTLLVIDRASPGHELPPRQGVGLARKIAADLALALLAGGSIESPWIHCTRIGPNAHDIGSSCCPATWLEC